MSQKEVVTIRLPADVKAKLEALAARTNRSKLWLAAQAIAAYVEDQSWQVQQIEEAVTLADSQQAVWMDGAKVHTWLDSWGTGNEKPLPTKMGSKPFKSTEANLKRMKVLESTAVMKVKLMSLSLQKIFSEIDQLTPQEQLTVMEYLVDRVRNHLAPSQPLRKWSDLKGMAPYPLLGEDAQNGFRGLEGKVTSIEKGC